MRPLILGIAFVLGFALFASACGGQTTVKDTFDDLGKPLLEHPTETRVEFSDSVSERDRQLITMAVEITKPLFEDIGFPLGANIYVAGDENSYLSFATALGIPPEKAREKYGTTRGSTNGYHAWVLINIPLHDTFYDGDQRDATLVFTVVHEFYHVLQTRLSEGWSKFTEVPFWIKESSANLFAYRAILKAFCVPLTDINSSVASFAKTPDCPKKFVDETTLDYAIFAFLKDKTIPSAIELYLIAEFGLGAYDRFYRSLPEVAATFTDGVAEAYEQLWLRALERTFNAPSLGILEDRASAYIKEHGGSLLQRLKKYE